jgi:hypothetical protein
MISLLLGFRLGCTKLSSFLCEQGILTRESHYSEKRWPLRQTLISGQKMGPVDLWLI